MEKPILRLDFLHTVKFTAMVVVVEALPPLIQTKITSISNPTLQTPHQNELNPVVICDHPDSKHGIGVGLVGPLWSANDERVSDQDVDLVEVGSQAHSRLRV